MINQNLRHLRVFLAVSERKSITAAAEECYVSQPAVTQAITKLEQRAEAKLFDRRKTGLFLTEEGSVLAERVRVALGGLDRALGEVSPRLVLTATRAQLSALVAACQARNFSLAAKQIGVAQPTLHRAVTQLEREAGRALFARSPTGVQPTRAAQSLARAVQLAFAELAQAEAELGDLGGREVGQIVLGALPLSRSFVLPRALTAFRRQGRRMPVIILDGSYDQLLEGLRTGQIDVVIGALRPDLPVDDVTQERLFDDHLVVLAGPGHPLLQSVGVSLADLSAYPWLITHPGTPTRAQIDRVCEAAGQDLPENRVETGSITLVREILQDGRHLAISSRLLTKPEIERGQVFVLPTQLGDTPRPIGLTYRKAWRPTPAQQLLVDLLRKAQSS